MCIYRKKEKVQKSVPNVPKRWESKEERFQKSFQKKEKSFQLIFKELKSVTSFRQWLEKYEDENSPEGDFARDVIVDEDFPIIQTKEFVENYLIRNSASDRTMEIFYEVWDRFENRS